MCPKHNFSTPYKQAYQPADPDKIGAWVIRHRRLNQVIRARGYNLHEAIKAMGWKGEDCLATFEPGGGKNKSITHYIRDLGYIEVSDEDTERKE